MEKPSARQVGGACRTPDRLADAASVVVLEGEEDTFAARYLDAAGRMLGALVANRPGAVAALRRELAA